MNDRLWDFQCVAVRLASGRFRVTITTRSGEVRTREGYHPLHELIRLIGSKKQVKP